MPTQNCKVGKSYGKQYYKTLNEIQVIEPEEVKTEYVMPKALTVFQASLAMAKAAARLQKRLRPTPDSFRDGALLLLQESNPIPQCPGAELCDPHPIIGYPAEYCGRCKKQRS